MLVYFGIGNIASKTIEKYHHKPDFFVDNSEAFWGMKWREYIVKSPEVLKKGGIKKIIICSTSYKEILIQLNEIGIRKDIIEAGQDVKKADFGRK